MKQRIQALLIFACFFWTIHILQDLGNFFLHTSSTSATGQHNVSTAVDNDAYTIYLTTTTPMIKKPVETVKDSTRSKLLPTVTPSYYIDDSQKVDTTSPSLKSAKKAMFQNQGSIHDNLGNNQKYMTFQLIQGSFQEYNYTFDPIKSKCKNVNGRVPLPIPSEKGVTDFRTKIKTNLNILYIGDSVGTQFAQSLQEAAGAKIAQTIRYAWGPHKLSHIAQVEGGGIVAGLRVTGFFLEEWKNTWSRVAPSPGGGWLESDVQKMKRLVHCWYNVSDIRSRGSLLCSMEEEDRSFSQGHQEVEQKKNTQNSTHYSTFDQINELEHHAVDIGHQRSQLSSCSCQEDNFDVVVHQFPAAWIYESSFKQVLHKSMSEDLIMRSITDTLKVFGPKIIVVQTVPIMNNMFSATEYVETNRNILNVVKKVRDTNHEVNILVMDIAALSLSFVLKNALFIDAISSEARVIASQYDATLNNNSSRADSELNNRHQLVKGWYGSVLSHFAHHEDETSTYSIIGDFTGVAGTITTAHNHTPMTNTINNSSNTDTSKSYTNDSVAIANNERSAYVHDFSSIGTYTNQDLVELLDIILQQRLKKKRRKQYWTTIISHGCGKFVEPNTTVTCPVGNQFSTDGQHWCMDKIGSRIDGVLACLLECSLKYQHHNKDMLDRNHDEAVLVTKRLSLLDECERECNSKFMNLSPIVFE